jgi:hypothetical protein
VMSRRMDSVKDALCCAASAPGAGSEGDMVRYNSRSSRI